MLLGCCSWVLPARFDRASIGKENSAELGHREGALHQEGNLVIHEHKHTHTRAGTWSFLLVLTVSHHLCVAPNNKQATSLTTLL